MLPTNAVREIEDLAHKWGHEPNLTPSIQKRKAVPAEYPPAMGNTDGGTNLDENSVIWAGFVRYENGT